MSLLPGPVKLHRFASMLTSMVAYDRFVAQAASFERRLKRIEQADDTDIAMLIDLS